MVVHSPLPSVHESVIIITHFLLRLRSGNPAGFLTFPCRGAIPAAVLLPLGRRRGYLRRGQGLEHWLNPSEAPGHGGRSFLRRGRRASKSRRRNYK